MEAARTDKPWMNRAEPNIPGFAGMDERAHEAENGMLRRCVRRRNVEWLVGSWTVEVMGKI